MSQGSAIPRRGDRADIARRIRRALPSVGLIALALIPAAIAIWVLESLGVADASSAFLLAVVAVAALRGTGPAIATAVGAFLTYDFFFIEPLHTFTVHDPQEWLNLLLLLVIGVVVGRLAGRSRDRAVQAIEGEREASAMFGISFTLASDLDTAAALGPVAEIVRSDTRAGRIWIMVANTLVADTATGLGPPSTPSVHAVLRRRPGDEPSEWVRVHVPGAGPRSGQSQSEHAYRVAITTGEQTWGSIWLSRPRDLGDPDPGETRVIAAAADQIGGALQRDRLQRDATSAEISRRSEAIKSALLDSVSHDLRTPLASIRAAAGTLMDPDVDWPADERRGIAASIDREAEWLNRLVTNLLDMSRVEAGELRPNLAAFAVAELVAEAVTRSGIATAGREVAIDVSTDLPPVLADEVLFGQVLSNTLDNASKYAGPTAPMRISAVLTPERMIRLTVEDGGPGVPPETLPRLFEKFYRVPRKGEGSRRGTGIGLAVVRGLVEAMDGHVEASASDLGGLAITFEIPVAAPEPPDGVVA